MAPGPRSATGLCSASRAKRYPGVGHSAQPLGFTNVTRESPHAQSVLLVGSTYAGPPISDTRIDVLKLCRPSVDKDRAAYALYEYDVVIINRQSYSHFIFGLPTAHWSSERELWDLKGENIDFHLDRMT